MVRNTLLYSCIRESRRRAELARTVIAWERNGRPLPPPHAINQRTLLGYAKTYGLRVFVETGTYLGEMVDAVRTSFDLVYSIELSPMLFEGAQKRFKGVKNVQLIQGDSGTELGKLLTTLNQPALFWLDGHYSAGITARGSKDTPILDELSHVLASRCRGHVVIIDDARAFGADPGYPSIPALKTFINSKRQDVEVSIQDDSIRILPT